jgi:hypothetical protein
MFARYASRYRYLFILLGLCVFPVPARNAVALVPTTTPLLISQETSTRAVALDSLSFASEPFALISPYAAGSDRRTRITLFAMHLSLQPGEPLSLVTADAEDAAHQHYNLAVEYVGPVPQHEWLSAVVLKLNDNLGDVGDVLIRVSYRGSNSNRVRVGIGHLGGGPADDPGATPTPVRPFEVDGQFRDDNGQLLAGIELTLTDRTDGTTSTATTDGQGEFSFGVWPEHSFTVTPSATSFFSFNAQSVDGISDNRLLSFNGLRRVYKISGRVTGQFNKTYGVTVNLAGFVNATTFSDSNGNFEFASLPAGRNYTISALSTIYYTFSNQTFNSLGADQVFDLPGTLREYTVSGHALLGQSPASQLAISISGYQTLTVTTDDDGRYSISLPAGGDYTFTPSLPFWDFAPGSWHEPNLTSDLLWHDFGAVRQTHTISGALMDQQNQGLAGITVNLSGPESRTTVTDGNGHYEFSHVGAGFSYTVTPSSTVDYTFAGQSVPQLSVDQTLNFTGLYRHILKGTVRDEFGDPIGGVTLTLSGAESASTVTGTDGSYSLRATANGSYFLTPSMPQKPPFNPTSVPFIDLSNAQTTDFTTTLLPDSGSSYVLEFDGTPKTVDYGQFWQEGVNLGHFFWEFWAMPSGNGGATYLLSDGYGGAHALLFGVGSFNTSEPDRFEMLGDIFDGMRFDNFFGSDQGPAIGEWAHFAVGWDGQNIITYYNGVPVGKTRFSGPRRTPGFNEGGGRLLIGGSDHSNFDGRIAQVRGYEDTNPREDLSGGVEASFAPQTIFGLGGSLLSYYFREGSTVADLSHGYRAITHSGRVRGTTAGILADCVGCPPPQFVIDPSAPHFETGAAPPAITPPAVTAPAGALVFDSFSRANSTYTFAGHGGLSSTEGGSAGKQVWQTNQATANPQPFGILNARAVLLGNSTALAWVPTGSDSGNLDVSVNRVAGRWGSGIHTGLSFRVVDANNFFFAYTTDTGGTPNNKIVRVGYYLNGQRVDLTNGATIADSWTTLRVVIRGSGELNVYIDSTLVYSNNNPLLASATGAGLYSDSVGKGLVNRWDNFTVFPVP